MASIEPRYAEALLALAQTPDESEKILKTIKSFAKDMYEMPDLGYFMLNPVVPGQAKKDLIKKMLDEPVYAVNFLCLLVDKGRLRNLKGILEEYRLKKAKLAGDLVITATTAKPLTDGEISEISRKYGQKYGASRVQVENRVDPALLGGIRIQIGDLLIDDTVVGRLRGLADTVGCRWALPGLDRVTQPQE